MIVDFHSHILPGVDDGAQDLKMSLDMLTILKKQGVGLVAATPHFYPHRQPLTEFLHNRQQAYEKLKSQWEDDTPGIMLAAEVYVERDIHKLDLHPLCYDNTDLLLVELPYTYHHWSLEEVYNLSINQSIKPVFAHLDRYMKMYSQDEVEEILSFDNAVFQFNHNALFHHETRHAVVKLIKQDYPVIFGSDFHNFESRISRWLKARSVLKSKLKAKWLEQYDEFCMDLIL